MSEASFWDYLRVLLPKEIHYSRIESDTSSGFPDVHYTLESCSGTIELKDTKSPRAKYPFADKNGLRGSQINWIRDEIAAGGVVLLALQREKEVYILPAKYCYAELHEYSYLMLKHWALLHWAKGPPGYDRAGITRRLREILTNPF
jgi:hypothetical protein